MEQQNQQPIQKQTESKPLIKTNWKYITIVAVLGLVVGGGIVWYVNSLQVEPQDSQQIIIPRSIPSPTPSKIDTSNWKVYRNEDVVFKFPSQWIEKPNLIRGSGFTQEFEDPESKFSFTFLSNGNYSQATGRPYASLEEFIGMPYKVKAVTIDGQIGRQPLPRAGSENVNSVIFFSKDSKVIYTLTLKTGNTALDTSETDIEEGQKMFDQILSTFRFTPTP